MLDRVYALKISIRNIVGFEHVVVVVWIFMYCFIIPDKLKCIFSESENLSKTYFFSDVKYPPKILHSIKVYKKIVRNRKKCLRNIIYYLISSKAANTQQSPYELRGDFKGQKSSSTGIWWEYHRHISDEGLIRKTMFEEV